MFVPSCIYCLNGTKFCQMILKKIIKTVTIASQILWLHAPNSPLEEPPYALQTRVVWEWVQSSHPNSNANIPIPHSIPRFLPT